MLKCCIRAASARLTLFRAQKGAMSYTWWAAMIQRSLKHQLFPQETIFALANNAKFEKICKRSAPMVCIGHLAILPLAWDAVSGVSNELSLYFSATETDFRGVQNTQQLQKWVMAGKLRV